MESQPNFHEDERLNRLFESMRQGDEDAAQTLFPRLYQDLRRLAQKRMRYQRPDHTLCVTALVHEVYPRLFNEDRVVFNDMNHFLACASQAMRQVLVDYARSRARLKRSPNGQRVPLDNIEDEMAWECIDHLALDEALGRLAERDKRAAKIIELRYYGCLTVLETARVLELSERTVERESQFARSWLKKEMG
ncbi:MAG: ECF-type sigma factor [Planctomycetota bacterium]